MTSADGHATVPEERAEAVSYHVREVVAASLELPVEDVTPESSLADLGAESLDLLEMAFRLEKDYRIRFPSTGILERAAEHFGRDALTSDGMVTELGLELLRIGMPELDGSRLRPGLRDLDVTRMVEVQSLVRITLRLLEAKDGIPRTCPRCGGPLEESAVMPEFECPACAQVVAVPNGDDVLLQDLIALHEEVQRRQ